MVLQRLTDKQLRTLREIEDELEIDYEIEGNTIEVENVLQALIDYHFHHQNYKDEIEEQKNNEYYEKDSMSDTYFFVDRR